MVQKIGFLATFVLCLSVANWLSGNIVAEEFKPVAFKQKEVLEVKVYRLIIDPTSKQPVVFLADSLEERALLIWIGPFEANAIYSELEGIKNRRPSTHDLLERIIQKANEKIRKIVITHQQDGIYYATISLEKAGSLVEIDARPSDSIVMALKFKAPIFVSKTLFKDMSIPLGDQKEIEEQYGLTLQDLTPSLAQSFAFGSTHGVLVSDVRKGSRAEKDGVERGDIFVEIGGRNVENMISFKDALEQNKDPVQARIFRKAHFLSITLHPK
jgi:bifunctional DNase/RNase